MSHSSQAERHRVFLLPYSGKNPYQRFLVRELRALDWRVAVRSPHAGLRGLVARQRCDPGFMKLLHVHWLPKFAANRLIFSWLAFVRDLTRLRRMGVRIVWTVHDLYDPEARWRSMDRWLVRYVFRNADAVILHSRAAIDQVTREFDTSDRAKMHVVPHPGYIGCYPDTLSREEARESFGIGNGELVFLFFGAIRRYKGVPDLLEAFSELAGNHLRLIVAGRAWEEALHRYVEEMGAGDPRVIARLGFVEDTEVQCFMKAADVVVLPYREYLTSGAVALAMSFARACIIPSVGSMSEVVPPNGGIRFDPADSGSLRLALAEAAARHDELEAMGRRNFKEISAWTWGRMARQTADVYVTALNRKPKREGRPS